MECVVRSSDRLDLHSSSDPLEVLLFCRAGARPASQLQWIVTCRYKGFCACELDAHAIVKIGINEACRKCQIGFGERGVQVVEEILTGSSRLLKWQFSPLQDLTTCGQMNRWKKSYREFTQRGHLVPGFPSQFLPQALSWSAPCGSLGLYWRAACHEWSICSFHGRSSLGRDVVICKVASEQFWIKSRNCHSAAMFSSPQRHFRNLTVELKWY